MRRRRSAPGRPPRSRRSPARRSPCSPTTTRWRRSGPTRWIRAAVSPRRWPDASKAAVKRRPWRVSWGLRSRAYVEVVQGTDGQFPAGVDDVRRPVKFQAAARRSGYLVSTSRLAAAAVIDGSSSCRMVCCVVDPPNRRVRRAVRRPPHRPPERPSTSRRSRRSRSHARAAPRSPRCGPRNQLAAGAAAPKGQRNTNPGHSFILRGRTHPEWPGRHFYARVISIAHRLPIRPSPAFVVGGGARGGDDGRLPRRGQICPPGVPAAPR